MSTSDLDALRDELKDRLTARGAFGMDLLDDLEAAVDAKARADERERIAQNIERDGMDPGRYTLSHPFGNTLRVMGLVRDDCARIARDNEGTTTP